jgi:hypothetical protein
MKSQLLCTFAHVKDLKIVIEYITQNYKLETNTIFVFENADVPGEIYCTYNVLSVDRVFENTILIHRKKESNTLYTINALNRVIRELNGGSLDRTFILDWTQYQNTLLITAGPDVRAVRLKLLQTIKKIV